MTSSHIFMTSSVVAMLCMCPALAIAQQATDSAAATATVEPRSEMSYWIGLSTSSPDTQGTDRNMAFGHSGGTFKIAPKLHSRWGHDTLIEATLRVDAQDGIYEAGVPLTLATGLRLGKGRLEVDLDLGVGFDHAGVASMLVAPNAIGSSWQRTEHAHLGMRYGALSWGVAAGDKRYRAHIEDHVDLDRRWAFARPYLSWRAHERIEFELSSQLQWWRQVAPGDLMREGDLSLTHQAAAHLQVTDEVTVHLIGGMRRDTLDARARPFGGVQLTWSPSFGTPREQISPSSE